MKKLALLIGLLLSQVSYGQIEVPPSSEPYRVLSATVKAQVPEGATFDGGWTASEGVSWLVHDGSTIHLTASPGEHALSYAGFWVHTKTVTFKDGDGNEISIESYLGSGRVNESAEFTVLGGADPVLPQPQPPAPGGKKAIVFFIQSDELDKMSYAQRYIVTSRDARKHLAARGHEFKQVIDDDQITDNAPADWKPWIEAVKGDPLPRVALAPIEGGPVLDYPLPVDYKHLLELLGETP